MSFFNVPCRGKLLISNNYLFKCVLRWGSSTNQQKTAGVIVIGNEILKAQVRDTNSHFICKHLYRCGVKVEKISVIGDNVDEIAQEIKHFSKNYTHVITSGGIGPTHDDVTYEGLAKAFNDTLHRHPVIAEAIRKYFRVEDPSSPAYKLAEIPMRAVLKFGINETTKLPHNFPCVILENVYVFPGSPIFLERGFGSLCKALFDSNSRFVCTELLINASEEVFADVLTSLSKEYPNVIFGSYPEEASNYIARVTIESTNKSDMEKAKRKFCSLLPPHIIKEKS